MSKISMRRAIAPKDILSFWHSYREIREMAPDILHSHGAKGGAYARIIGSLVRLSGKRVARLYCPHGGAMHYDKATLAGKIYFRAERFLERMTDRLIFVSEYERNAYHDKVGDPRCPESLIYNGLGAEEFLPVTLSPKAADFLYIGMMRDLKGPDLFLHAFRRVRDMTDRDLKARFVGDGPDKEKYTQLITDIGLAECITIHDAMPAREAFCLGKIIVVPSRAESMPYLVLEAVAAAKPIVATKVGGIPEIFHSEPDLLVPPDDVELMAIAMRSVLEDTKRESRAKARVQKLRERFSHEVMLKDVHKAYLACL